MGKVERSWGLGDFQIRQREGRAPGERKCPQIQNLLGVRT